MKPFGFSLLATGGRLRALKEQLEQKMKLKRAERRELQEAQRKIDNEEITDEEEAEMTEAEGTYYTCGHVSSLFY